MSDKGYDPKSETDIVRFARGLIDKSLAQACALPSEIVKSGAKGRLGNLVEEFYFGYKPNSSPLPDFPDAKLELKVTGLKRDKSGAVKAKERLSLTLINFHEIVDETFETSSLISKCGRMLILCYEYIKDVNEVDLKFTKNQFVYSITSNEVEQIKRDWQTIQRFVREGRAHEISEGDTFYLKASRKGAGKGKDGTSQPFSKIRANRRGFSFNSGYMSGIIDGATSVEGSLQVQAHQTIEEATSARLSPYLGLSKQELLERFGGAGESKAAIRNLTERMLSDGETSVREMQKAGIMPKIVYLKHSGKATQSMSFKAFDYLKVEKTSWEDSDFAEQLEQKFLFVVFQEDEAGVPRFRKFGYWNMPFQDRNFAREVYEETQQRIIDRTYVFPKLKSNPVSHVRPHGKNSRDVVECPDGQYRMRKSFWLNQKYIEKVVSNL